MTEAYRAMMLVDDGATQEARARLIANPIPEADALSPDFIDGTIRDAVKEAETRGIQRKEVTPFLLARINELSGGRSLKANIALVRNNAKLAAQVAVAHARLRRSA